MAIRNAAVARLDEAGADEDVTADEAAELKETELRDARRAIYLARIDAAQNGPS